MGTEEWGGGRTARGVGGGAGGARVRLFGCTLAHLRIGARVVELRKHAATERTRARSRDIGVDIRIK